MKLSKKQNQLIQKIIEKNQPRISAIGSVQSGKTFAICLGTILYAQELYKYDKETKYFGAIVGWDLETLKGNIIEAFETILEEAGLRRDKDFEIKFGFDKYIRLYNTTFFFFGFNTKLSFNKILGRPLIYIWVDEAARIYSQNSLQESFDEMPRKTSKLQWAPI